MQIKFVLSDHYDGKKFLNQDKSIQLKIGLKNVLKWQLKDKIYKWPKYVENTVKPNILKTITKNNAAVTFINHATFLLQLEQLAILTDPVFSNRVSPFSWIGPKRIRPPGILIEELPKIDVITISHNHYDHMDLMSLKKLNQLHQPLFIVPLGNAHILQTIGIKQIIELDWWQHTQVKNCLIYLVPAQHWSGRNLHDRYKSLWGGFVYKDNSFKIYFAGDTGYNQHFKQIFDYFGPMDISLLPIGAYEPRWFMKEQHVNPEEAVQAHLDLHSKLSIGMHFGTFALSSEGFEHPKEDLNMNLIKYQLDLKTFITLELGETKFIQSTSSIV